MYIEDHYAKMKWANWQFIVALAATLHASLCLGSFCNVADNITHSLYGQDVTFNWTSSEAPLASRWWKNNYLMMGRISNGDVLYENGFTADKVWPIGDTAFTLARATTEDNNLYTCDHLPVNGGNTFVVTAQSQLQVHIVSVDDLLPNLLLNDTEFNSEMSVDSRNEQTLSSSAPVNDPACVNVLINVVGVDHNECSHLSSTPCSLVLGRDSMLHTDTVNVSVSLFHPLVGSQKITRMLYTHATPAVTKDLPEGFNISTEGNLDISCSFSARPAASVVWLYTNGSALPGDIYSITEFISGDALKIISSRLQWIPTADHTARIGQGGLIRCISGNDHGIVASGGMDLNVQYGPVDIRINSTDNEFSFIEGDIFTPLACVANCNPACRYSWYWANGTVVAVGNTLTFEPFNRMYHGIFHCRATNGIDSDGNTFTVKLYVFYGPSIHSFTVNSPNEAVSQHDDVTFLCNTDSRPMPVITLIRPSGDTLVSSSTSNTLEYTLTDIDCLGSGYYKCVAFNALTGRQHITLLPLTVQCPPRKFVSSNIWVAAAEGDTLTFSITVVAYPEPTFTWSKQHKGYATEQNGDCRCSPDVCTRSTLTLPHITQDEFGNYSVTTSNPLGEMEGVVFTLSTSGKPDIPTKLRVNQANAVTITMRWTSGWNRGAEQVFTLMYRLSDSDDSYIRIADIIDPGQGETVTCKAAGLLPDTSYDFIVQAKNRFGSIKTKSIAALSAAAPLMDTDESLFVAIFGNTASIKWTLHSYRGPITKVDINSCDVSSARCFLTTVLNITSAVEVAVPEGGSSYSFVFMVYDGNDLLLNVNHFIKIDTGPPTGLVVGVVVVAVLLCAVAAVIGVTVWKRRRRRETASKGRNSLQRRARQMFNSRPDKNHENDSPREREVSISDNPRTQQEQSPYEQIEDSAHPTLSAPSVYERPQTLRSVVVPAVYETLHPDDIDTTPNAGQSDNLELSEYANMA